MNQREITALDEKIEEEQRTLDAFEKTRDDRIADLHGLTAEIRLVRSRIETLRRIKEGWV